MPGVWVGQIVHALVGRRIASVFICFGGNERAIGAVFERAQGFHALVPRLVVDRLTLAGHAALANTGSGSHRYLRPALAPQP